MTARYNTYNSDRKITAPKPTKDKRGGSTPSVNFRKMSQSPTYGKRGK